MIILIKIKQNIKWSYIPDLPYRMLIIRGTGSGKINALLIRFPKLLNIAKFDNSLR